MTKPIKQLEPITRYKPTREAVTNSSVKHYFSTQPRPRRVGSYRNKKSGNRLKIINYTDGYWSEVWNSTERKDKANDCNH